MLKNNSVYDKYIFCLIFSLAFGQIGGYLQFARVLTICLFPVLLSTITKVPNSIKKNPCSFVMLCVVWGGISLLWSNSISEGLKMFVYYLVHFSLFIEVIVFSYFSLRPLKIISLSWISALVLTLSIAIWEIQTGHHLYTSTLEEGHIQNYGGVINLQVFAASTFGNYNEFELFICYCTPFLLYLIFITDKLLIRIAYFLILGVSFYVVVVNASRAASITMLIYFVLSVRYILKKGGKSVLSYIVLIIALAGVLYVYSDSIFTNIFLRLESGGLESSRSEIYDKCLSIFLNTYLMGIGIGSLESSGMAAFHNMFIEVALTFGIFVFIVFLRSLWVMYKRTLHIFNIEIKTMLLCALIALPVYSIINAIYLPFPNFYVYFASLYVFLNYSLYNYEYA